MSVRLLGVLAAMTAMGLVACGDDTGGVGGSGAGGGTGGDGTTTTGTTTSGGEGGNGTGGDAATTSTSTGGEGGEGGGGELLPCEEVCADDAGCDLDPADPGDECGQCVQDEADARTECALAGALGPCCTEDPNCQEYVDCVLASGATCEADHPEGAARGAACVLASCGACGSPE